MNVWIIVIAVVAVLVAAGLAITLLWRQGTVETPPRPIAPTEEDLAARRDRQQILEERGEELLERRVQLEQERNTLGGNSGVYDAFIQLEERLRRGEISEQEFETEKIRLLGG